MWWQNTWDASTDLKCPQCRYISELGLWRSGDEQNNPPHGWNGKTGDINRGRGGDYLYLVWKTKQYVGPK